MGPYIYADVASLEGKAELDTGHCARLVQLRAKAPLTSQWRRGPRVLDMDPADIKPGTAIATFSGLTDELARYPLEGDHRRHAMLFMSFIPTAPGKPRMYWAMEQYVGKGRIGARRFIGLVQSQLPDGCWPDGSNNGNAYYVVL